MGEPLEIYPNSNVSFSNDLGFRLGVLADYTVSKNFSISPKAELSLNNSTINLTQDDGSVSEFDVMPISLEFNVSAFGRIAGMKITYKDGTNSVQGRGDGKWSKLVKLNDLQTVRKS